LLRGSQASYSWSHETGQRCACARASKAADPPERESIRAEKRSKVTTPRSPIIAASQQGAPDELDRVHRPALGAVLDLLAAGHPFAATTVSSGSARTAGKSRSSPTSIDTS
jgi:hypothetical protein